VGLLAGQNWCISGNPGNKLYGHHLSVGSPSVCSQVCPVKYYGLECWIWAVVGSDSRDSQKTKDLCSGCQTTNPIRPDDFVASMLKILAFSPQEEYTYF